jgi:UDP-GlcNAc:undecaprenyl-phosphate GlcNAc-1-phosphate transferase
MKSYISAFLVAAVLNGLATPLMRKLALRLGAVAHPGGRNIHRQSVPRLGGVPIGLATLVPVVALLFVRHSVVAQAVSEDALKVIGVVVGGVAMCALGAVDDLRGMRALHKLIAQVGVGALAFACGLRIESVFLPIVGGLSMGPLALPITVFWFVGVINAINLIDGLDGLAAGVVFFAGVTNFTVAAIISQDAFTAVLLASMLGAVLAFLFYNSNPARIFMGDSGSYFLGFLLAATSLSGGAPKVSTAVALAVPVLALGVPIFDTLFAMVRRILERRSPFAADRRHIHHRLLDLGLTQHRAVLILYGATVGLTGFAIALALDRSWDIGVALVIGSIALIGIIRFFSGRREHAWSNDAVVMRNAMPELSRRLAIATSHDDMLFALRSFCEKARLDFVEIIGADGEPAFRWPERHALQERSRSVTAVYPMGVESAARASLRLGWRNDGGDVALETSVLLQVVTDLLAWHFARLESELGPERARALPTAPPVQPSIAPESDPDVAPASVRPVHESA